MRLASSRGATPPGFHSLLHSHVDRTHFTVRPQPVYVAFYYPEVAMLFVIAILFSLANGL